MSHTVTQTIRVHVARYRESDLLMARSDDLPGLMVTARSESALQEQTSMAIQELLEAEGKTVISVDLLAESQQFVPPTYIASAALAA